MNPNVQTWPKMTKNDQKWPKMAQNGQKWPKWYCLVKNIPTQYVLQLFEVF